MKKQMRKAIRRGYEKEGRMVEREGFEPSKAEPSDLQSDPFGRSGISPHGYCVYSSVMKTHHDTL